MGGPLQCSGGCSVAGRLTTSPAGYTTSPRPLLDCQIFSLWPVFGQSLDSLWTILGYCLDDISRVFCRCLDGIQAMLGRCLASVWPMFRQHFDSIPTAIAS